MLRFLLLLSLLWVTIHAAAADEIYQQPLAFIREVFSEKVPVAQKLWITGELRTRATAILGHAPETLRISYWRRGKRTAWILNEIGKEQPITAGFLIDNGSVVEVRVLIFRETRGWEIRYPFFTDQFSGSMLEHDNKLNRKIDGISGATLSVNAITKLTRLALLYHQQVTTGK